MTRDKAYWLRCLEEEYTDELRHPECGPSNRLEYLSVNIFKFCTDDGELDEYFAEWAVKACYAINTRNFPRYIDGDETYRWMIAMYNMPFFEKRTCFGVSIRYPFWSINGHETEFKMDFCGSGRLFGFGVSREEWESFITAVIEFSGVDLTGFGEPL